MESNREGKMIDSHWLIIWQQFKKSKIGFASLLILLLFFLIGLYAPLLASSKPIVVYWNQKFYFPLFRYLFYPGFYTKPIDLFYNILMFTFPLGLLGFFVLKGKTKKGYLFFLGLTQIALFIFFLSGIIKNPESAPSLKLARKEILSQEKTYREDPLLTPILTPPSWQFELKYMSLYEKMNLLLRYRQKKMQHVRLKKYLDQYQKEKERIAPTLWEREMRYENEKKKSLESDIAESEESYQNAVKILPDLMMRYRPHSHEFIMAKYALEHSKDQSQKDMPYRAETQGSDVRNALSNERSIIQNYRSSVSELQFLNDRRSWLEDENQSLHILIPPLIRFFHWEEDAGGAQGINQYVPWWELSRINRKDLVSSLIFGIRISLIVGVSAIALSLLIGIPLGTFAGYFAGKADLIICRLIEIWEAMPTFFMLLLIIAVTQTKSILLIIGVLGIFGWTGFGRFIRAEVLKQRNLPYVLACKSIGFSHPKIMFSHILPNAIPPILTLLPFTMMAAITSEAALSFLGLGEEGSTSWGVLMDEGRTVFPGESYLLWPPAILLTILLVSIAIVGDTLRDAIDPKMRS